MSARALNWCWQQSPGTTTQKLVLAALSDRADDDGECFPSLEWITAKCAPLKYEAAKKALKALHEQGYVEKVDRRRRGDGTLGTWLLRLPLDQGEPATRGNPGHVAPIPAPEVTGYAAEPSIEPSILTGASPPTMSDPDEGQASLLGDEPSADIDPGLAAARYLKDELVARGVSTLQRDFVMKGAAVARAMLREGLAADELRELLEWCLAHPWHGTRVTRMEKVRDLAPTWQQERNGIGPRANVGGRGLSARELASLDFGDVEGAVL